MQGLASPPRPRLPRASAWRLTAPSHFLGPDRTPRAMKDSSPATTQMPSSFEYEASPSATAPLGDDDAGSSSDPSQSRRATLIAGGVAAGMWIEIRSREKGERESMFRSLSFSLSLSLSLSLSTQDPLSRPSRHSLTPSLNPKKQKRPSLPRPAPPRPSSPSRTRTPSPATSAPATLSAERGRPKQSRPLSSWCRSASSRRAASSLRTGRATSGRSWESAGRSLSRPERRSRTSSRSFPRPRGAGEKKKAEEEEGAGAGARGRGGARRGKGPRGGRAGTRAPRPPTPSASRTSGSAPRSLEG